MDWSAAGAPLLATRAVHFAATAITVGDVMFRTVIAASAFRPDAAAPGAFEAPTLRVSWLGLGVALISGAIWLLLQAASMSGMPLDQAMSADVLPTVINETQFGQVTTLRAGLAVCLAACLTYHRVTIARWLGFAAAIAFAASLAWTGHAASTAGEAGYLHLAADALHLTATAAWIGGLASLILFLGATYQGKAVPLIRDVVGRFSIMGMVSVLTLLVTGFINAAILVGSMHALIVTEYGRLLLLKLVLVALMLILALINRLVLTPRLTPFGNGALRRLTRNSTIELALGLAILAIVGVLGTMHPAIHLVN
ncbi:copper homeostasis membrane protein CopD [Bradyrhizobium sp. CB1650]|uniref:copper homeostasis membrane protein CopD n=1 Tax=Bradyrhizobium sp. CB1650 TaxID=3039153 RepID=UPI002435E244|nr:copper homeostasis membrane protein CopD [Bradyrhizobium sp. CB1650]WGD56324.1 copper homeostasis membrane protein CopD [Bradyrhizobium sp. CB1650]